MHTLQSSNVVNIKPTYNANLIEKVETLRDITRKLKEIKQKEKILIAEIEKEMGTKSTVVNANGMTIATYEYQLAKTHDKNKMEAENSGIIDLINSYNVYYAERKFKLK